MERAHHCGIATSILLLQEVPKEEETFDWKWERKEGQELIGRYLQLSGLFGRDKITGFSERRAGAPTNHHLLHLILYP